MTKLTLSKTAAFIYYSLILLAFKQFSNHFGRYVYKCISREEVGRNLWRELNPNLEVDPALAECEYTFVNSTVSLRPSEVFSLTHHFSSAGIVNGSYSPRHCRPLYSVALLVTYRHREKQLQLFLPYMHNFLRKQNIHYKIYVIEQGDNKLWNKGVLYNVGAQYAISEQFRCLILHDVDLLPLDEANLYACLTSPRHMSCSIDKYNFVLPYTWLLGGVAAISAKHFLRVNGFSNKYYGWGGEDDDFALRLDDEDLKVLRFPRDMARYTMLKHSRNIINRRRHSLIEQNMHKYKEDGLSSVPAHTLTVSTANALYTSLVVRMSYD